MSQRTVPTCVSTIPEAGVVVYSIHLKNCSDLCPVPLYVRDDLPLDAVDSCGSGLGYLDYPTKTICVHGGLFVLFITATVCPIARVVL